MPSALARAKQRLRGTRGWEALVLARALAAGGERREAAVAMLLRPDNLFQPYTTTSADRYLDELAVVRETVGDPDRILSFGCAGGEELLSLRRAFPDARIDGIDINPLAVRSARRRVRGDTGITVTRAADAAEVEEAVYDVVLALAVFRHGALKSAPPRCDHLIRFADFERTVAGLAAAVRPGGVLVVRHASFRFGDTAAAAGFEPVRTGFLSASELGPTPVYGPDDALLDPSMRDDGVYRRRR